MGTWVKKSFRKFGSGNTGESHCLHGCLFLAKYGAYRGSSGILMFPLAPIYLLRHMRVII